MPIHDSGHFPKSLEVVAHTAKAGRGAAIAAATSHPMPTPSKFLPPCFGNKVDMDAQSYTEMKKAVLLGDAMDTQILVALKRWPAVFHIAMVPDFRGQLDQPWTEEDKALLLAQSKAWQGKLKLFQTKLKADQRLLELTRTGSAALHDILEWNGEVHARAQCELSDNLVNQFMDKFFPVVTGTTWADVPGGFSVAKSKDSCKGVTRVITVIDFNTPFARDALKLPAMASAIANVFKNVGRVC